MNDLGDIDLLIYPSSSISTNMNDETVCNEIKGLKTDHILTHDLAYPTNVMDDQTTNPETDFVITTDNIKPDPDISHTTASHNSTSTNHQKRKQSASSEDKETKTSTNHGDESNGHNISISNGSKRSKNHHDLSPTHRASYNYEGIGQLLPEAETSSTCHRRIDIRV